MPVTVKEALDVLSALDKTFYTSLYDASPPNTDQQTLTDKDSGDSDLLESR